MLSVIFQIQSALILVLFYVGIFLSSKRKLHVKIMSTGIIWDILLILQIELARSAIKTATKAATNPIIMNVHISLACTTVVFYIFMVVTGRKLLSGQNQVKALHKKLGITTISLRTLTLITSYLAVTFKA